MCTCRSSSWRRNNNIEYHLCVLCRQHAVFRCGLYLRMSHRSVVYVSVCVLATALSFAITYVPTETVWSRFAWAKEHVTGVMGGTHWRHLANTLDRSVRRRRYSLVGVNGTKIGLQKPEKCLQTVDCQEKNFFSCIKIFCKLFKHMVSNLLPRRDNATISCCAAVRKIIFGKDCNRRVTVKFSQGHWYW